MKISALYFLYPIKQVDTRYNLRVLLKIENNNVKLVFNHMLPLIVAVFCNINKVTSVLHSTE